ncbi:hypothetical protein E2C01_097927 [Portunus trituberculatus]|uniref:Uncharacterized protein n=1 Tax=Portunus trituberculatus TaxID=210409 RepID=A0A5B7KBI7_PORTR|nr:hypothetical protein [Portunus trituberculatus]
MEGGVCSVSLYLGQCEGFRFQRGKQPGRGHGVVLGIPAGQAARVWSWSGVGKRGQKMKVVATHVGTYGESGCGETRVSEIEVQDRRCSRMWVDPGCQSRTAEEGQVG